MNFIARTASVLGNVELGENTSVWYGAILRADSNTINIGKNTNVQDNAVIHTEKDKGVKIGDNVTIGHGAVVHSCDIGNNVLIGINSTILHNSVIGDYCIIGAGAVVLPGTRVQDGSVVVGVPAKVVREVTDEDREFIEKNAAEYVKLAESHIQGKVKEK